MKLGAFEIGTRFATGGMGQVWKGSYATLGTPVAIKVMTGPTASSETFRTGFKREVQATAKLNHPGIVDVYDFGVLPPDARNFGLMPGSPYFVMEFVQGASPLEVVQSWADLKHILTGTLASLAHAHAHGLIHRDIKPDNVIVERSSGGLGRVVLTDFGVVHTLDRNTSTHGEDITARSIEEVSGTPLYMAPEQFRGEFRDYGPWTDIYAVGIMAWHLACGAPPFNGKNPYKLARMHLSDPVPELDPEFEVPIGLNAWVKELTEKDFVKRPASAAEALEALLSLEDPEDLRQTSVQESVRDGFDFDDAPTMFVPTAEQAEPSVTRRFPPKTWSQATEVSGPLAVRQGLGLLALKTVPLTGRHAERDMLWRTFTDAWETRIPHTLIIRGLAGTGKSRLAQWLTQLALEGGHAAVFHATHQPEPGRMHGISWMLRQYFRAAGLSGETLVERIREVLGRHGVVDDYEVRGLAEIMREDIQKREGVPTTQILLSIEQRFELVRRVFARAAKDQVAIVWLDDGIWDREATSLIEYIHGHDEDTPVLFLLTVREESLDEDPKYRQALEKIEDKPHIDTLFLDFMDPESFDLLIQSGLGVTGKAADILRERCDGSPLFATQVVEFWLAQGVLAEENGQVVLKDENIAPPDTIGGLWRSRLEHLVEELAQSRELEHKTFSAPSDPDTVWRWLEFAAALGRDVDESEWLQSGEMAGLKAVGGLAEALVDTRLAESRERGFSFVHGLLRDSIHAHSVEMKRWKRINLTCARMLTSRYAQNHPGLSTRVARHFMEGGQLPLAQMCLLEALKRERATGLLSNVVAVCEMLEYTLKRSKVPESDAVWVDIKAAHGRVLLESARRHDLEDGTRLLNEAVQAGRAHSASAAMARALAGFGLSHVHQSMAIHGIPFVKEGLEMAPDDETRGECLLEMAEIYKGFNRHRESLEHAEIALALVNDPLKNARAYLLIGQALLGLEHPDAESTLSKGVELCRTHGFFLHEARFKTLNGFLADQRNDFQLALQEHLGAWNIFKTFEPEAHFALDAAQNTARAMLQCRRWDEALQILLQLERRLVAEEQIDVQIHDALLWASAATRQWTHFERAMARAFDFEKRAPTRYNARALRGTFEELLKVRERTRASRVSELSLEALHGVPGLKDDYDYFAEKAR